MTQIYIPDNESDSFIYLMDSVSLNGCPLTDTEVTAEQYLQFAARDLEDESDRGAVNGIGNAKRALHQTVDALLQAYGLLARNRRASFPQKLELIDKAGLFSLAILNTLNLERNAVEHEYRVPTHARVQEVTDVARSGCWPRSVSANTWPTSLWRAGGLIRHSESSSSIQPKASSPSSRSPAPARNTNTKASSTPSLSRSERQTALWRQASRSTQALSGAWLSATRTEMSGSSSPAGGRLERGAIWG
jgi:hypothetical protein